jgi:hypothetical protein
MGSFKDPMYVLHRKEAPPMEGVEYSICQGRQIEQGVFLVTLPNREQEERDFDEKKKAREAQEKLEKEFGLVCKEALKPLRDEEGRIREERMEVFSRMKAEEGRIGALKNAPYSKVRTLWSKDKEVYQTRYDAEASYEYGDTIERNGVSYSSSSQGGWTGGHREVLITKEGNPELYAQGEELFKDLWKLMDELEGVNARDKEVSARKHHLRKELVELRPEGLSEWAAYSVASDA